MATTLGNARMPRLRDKIEGGIKGEAKERVVKVRKIKAGTVRSRSKVKVKKL